MSLVGASASSQTIGPVGVLQNAIQDFQNGLSPEHRDRLRAACDSGAAPNAQDVAVFTANLDRAISEKKKGRSIASRLYAVLKSVQEFSGIVDTFVSSNPTIAALIWGSIKFTMRFAINYTASFEPLSNMFMSFSRHCPRFAEYQALFQDSIRLQNALCRFYAAIVHCCKRVMQVIQRPWTAQVVNSMWQSIDQEFKSDIEAITSLGDDVKEEIQLAKYNADREEQVLQQKERTSAWKMRKKLERILPTATDSLDTIKELELRRERRHTKERIQQLLDRLSTHDYRSPLNEACKKRHPETAEWIFSTAEFVGWRESKQSSVLWCSGKIGAGKTVLSANVITHLLDEIDERERLVYLFVRQDEPASQKAENILRSLLKQILDPNSLTHDIVLRLERLRKDGCPFLEECRALLQEQAKLFRSLYMILDGVDECDQTDRSEIWAALNSIIELYPCLKIFVAGRESLSQELRRYFPNLQRISMGNAKAGNDVDIIIKSELFRRVQSGQLSLGDPSLLDHVQGILSKHADGMIIWVTYLIDEVCAQCSDDDIRACLKDLPRDLEDTYNRALSRIVARKHAAFAQRVFPWIAVAKRPLRLDQLCEVGSVIVGNPELNLGGRINGVEHIATRCENLVQVNEELKTAQFAHASIYDFIISNKARASLAQFHFDQRDADHHAGEICVTYLHLNAFVTSLARRGPRMRLPNPVAIAEGALGGLNPLGKSLVKFIRNNMMDPKPETCVDVDVPMASFERADNRDSPNKLGHEYPFLEYAAENWLEHTKSLARGVSKTWVIWEGIITNGHSLAHVPWDNLDTAELFLDGVGLLRWALEAHHYAFLDLISTRGTAPLEKLGEFLLYVSKTGNREVVKVLLQEKRLASYLNGACEIACTYGHPGILQQVKEFALPAIWQFPPHLLVTACRHHHLAVVQWLLGSGVEVSRDMLAEVHSEDYLSTTQLLMKAGADNRALERILMSACERNLLDAASVLLNAGVGPNIMDPDNLQTALELVCQEGFHPIAELLIKAGANPGRHPGRDRLSWNRTALHLACIGRHTNIVDLLIKAGADVNAKASGDTGMETVLHWACQTGDFVIVHRLLAAGAKIKSEDLQKALKNKYSRNISRLLVEHSERLGFRQTPESR
ncbi:hypothetical protein B0I35DRAFT_514361 [Stachybotrys elegans]|uniref:NACHT domain-containing protein n=1 Tax=Stachybotrys elegans TaxID=80388 RepID=A0A8K0SPX1_9HYPO|nr:hypothetical protein B0I35DRAFT_514361 [Stachybotrys elegans]